jgi:hypothetical protein
MLALLFTAERFDEPSLGTCKDETPVRLLLSSAAWLCGISAELPSVAAATAAVMRSDHSAVSAC